MKQPTKYANHHLYSSHEVWKHLIWFMEEAGSQAELARRCGVSRSYLNDMMQGKRDLSERVLKALGFERVEFYRKLAAPKKKKEEAVR